MVFFSHLLRWQPWNIGPPMFLISLALAFYSTGPFKHNFFDIKYTLRTTASCFRLPFTAFGKHCFFCMQYPTPFIYSFFAPCLFSVSFFCLHSPIIIQLLLLSSRTPVSARRPFLSLIHTPHSLPSFYRTLTRERTVDHTQERISSRQQSKSNSQ